MAFSCLSHEADTCLKQIISDGLVFTEDDQSQWNGTHFLHVLVGEVRVGTFVEFECWLLDHHLPTTLLEPPPAIGQTPRKVTQFLLQFLVTPAWAIKPGMELTCKAVLFMCGLDKKAMVRTSHNVWINAVRVPQLTCGLVHLCCGAFHGWSQAAKKIATCSNQQICRQWAVSVDMDPQVCDSVALNEDCSVIHPPLFGITQPLDDHVVICIDVADPKWLSAVHDETNVGWTASFPCQPFSRGNNSRKGVNNEAGRVFFHICKWARLARPLIVALENVDEVAADEHMRLIKCFVKWAGFTIHWASTLEMASFAPCHRRRWLAVMVRNDVAKDNPLIMADIFKDDAKVSWDADIYKFPLHFLCSHS